MQRWMQRRRNADIGTARRGGGRERESKGRGGGRCGRHAATAGQGRGRGRESRYTSGNEEVGWPGEREPRLEGEEHRGRLAGRRRQAGGGRGGEAAVCFIGVCSVVAYRRLSSGWSRTGGCLAGGHVPAAYRGRMQECSSSSSHVSVTYRRRIQQQLLVSAPRVVGGRGVAEPSRAEPSRAEPSRAEPSRAERGSVLRSRECSALDRHADARMAKDRNATVRPVFS